MLSSLTPLLLGPGSENAHNDSEKERKSNAKNVQDESRWDESRDIKSSTPCFRQSLRYLTSKHLGKIIQVSSSTEGHSSAEDARMALE